MAAAQGAGSAGQAVSSVGNGYVQAAALRSQAGYQTSVTALNNKTLEFQAGQVDAQAADVTARGMQAATAQVQKARLQEGASKAAAAGQGGLGSVGSEAVDNAVAQTESVSAADAAAIKTNAWRAAYGLQTQAISIRGQEAADTLKAVSSSNALENAARSSMITGWSSGLNSGMKSGIGFSKNSKSSRYAGTDSGNGSDA